MFRLQLFCLEAEGEERRRAREAGPSYSPVYALQLLATVSGLQGQCSDSELQRAHSRLSPPNETK